jgi:hypothetical protein
MSKTRVPCALVTSMDRHTTSELLEKLGLRNYFSCSVTGVQSDLLCCMAGCCCCVWVMAGYAVKRMAD